MKIYLQLLANIRQPRERSHEGDAGMIQRNTMIQQKYRFKLNLELVCFV